ncbi:MAG: aldehyde dehydrogenase family protein, partial [Streptococcus thermophilus]
MREETLYYNGEWQKAQSTDYTDVINPTTEETIGKVVNANQQDVDLAVTSAKTAFSEWNQTNPETRADYMEKFLNGIKDRKQDLMDIMIKELGTSSIFADQTQVGLAVKEMSATIEEIRKYNFEETVDNATIIKEGFGVVACITPWNYPLNQIQRKITPALLAGNTVVVKPANMTPLTALLLAEIADEAGLPKGV